MKKRLKSTLACDCGFDRPVTLLNVSHEFPNSELGLAVCTACDVSTFTFNGPDDESACFEELMETLREPPQDVITNRLWYALN
jgi:hypothetical protein